MRWLVLAMSFVTLAGASARAEAQAAGGGEIYRVFLRTGEPLPSYGEAVQVGDRLIFNLPIHGPRNQMALQLTSLPLASIDLARTQKYTESMRAAFYAASRGEADYVAVTAEVSRALDQLAGIEDKRRRLTLAQQARQRLLTWSRENYSYRARDIQDLAGLFDDVISELRAAAGETSFAFDLVAGTPASSAEPLLAAPDERTSIELALAAALASDLVSERLAILRTAAMMAAESPELRNAVAKRLDDEVRTSDAYASLASSVRERASVAHRRGDVAAVAGLLVEVHEKDRALGLRRPEDIERLQRDLAERLEATRAFRLALDHYAFVRRSLLAYERKARPALNGLDSMARLLEAVRDMRSVAIAEIDAGALRLKQWQTDLGRGSPPDDLVAVNATLVSTLQMARDALARRRLSVATNKMETAREASSAAAGALLLTAEVRRILVASLFPPRPD